MKFNLFKAFVLFAIVLGFGGNAVAGCRSGRVGPVRVAVRVVVLPVRVVARGHRHASQGCEAPSAPGAAGQKPTCAGGCDGGQCTAPETNSAG